MFLIFLIMLSLAWWVIVSTAAEDEMADASDYFVASFKDTNKATNLENAFYMTLQVLMKVCFRSIELRHVALYAHMMLPREYCLPQIQRTFT